jgi:hypothetical protein
MPLPIGGKVVTLPRNPAEDNGTHPVTAAFEQKSSKLATVLAGAATADGTSLALMYVGNAVSGPTPFCGLNADAELRRVCTGRSRLRVPT